MRPNLLHRPHPVRTHASCIALLAAGIGAHAQTVAPSQVTPPSVRPQASAPAPSQLVVPADGTADSAAGDTLDVRPGSVQVEGGLPALQPAAAALVQALQDHRVSLSRIRQQVAALEEAYRRAGYFLVRVTLPPQRLRDGGPLHVLVVDGFIERVDVSGVPQRLREAVREALAPLVGRHGLTLHDTERRLRIAGALGGLHLHSALAAGTQPGGALLLVEGTLRNVSASITIDNGLADSLGSGEALLTLSVNSPFGHGERLYAAIGSSTNFAGWTSGDAPLALGAIGLVAPLGIEGWTLNPELTQTTLNPTPPSNGLRVRGELSRAALRLASPNFGNDDAGGAGELVLEHLSQRQVAPAFDATLSDDRYDALRLAFNASASLADNGAAVWGWLQGSQGLGGRAPDASTTAGPPLSRQGASPGFTHLETLLRLTWPLGNTVQVAMTAAGQAAFGRPQLISEQFAMSGPEKVSGLPAGSLSVDQGWTMRTELSWPLPATTDARGTALMVAPYVFYAGGAGRLLMPTAVESPSLHAHSTGFGLRASTFDLTGLQGQLGAELTRCWAPEGDQRWRPWLRLSLTL